MSDRITRLHALALLAVAALVAVGRGDQEQPAEKFKYQLFERPAVRFRCETPKDWTEIRDQREESRTHCYGIYLVGPAENVSLEPTLSARYFAPDNSLGDTAEKYLRRQLEPGIVQLRDEKTSAPETVKLDGRPATKFTRDTFEFYPPESLDAKRIPIREEYYVAPHLGGFVVLKYAAPTADFARWRPVLQRLLDTFRWLPERASVALHATAVGLPTRDVEATIAVPLEARLAGLAGLQSIRSASYPGECRLWLVLDYDAEFSARREEIQRRVALAKDALPPGVAVTLEADVADDAWPMLIALYSTDKLRARSDLLNQLESLATTTVLNRIAAVPGVASATLVGGRRRYEIVPSVERLDQSEVDVQDLFTAVRRFERPAGAAVVRVKSPDDLRRVPVAIRNSKPVLLGEIAEVRFGRADGAPNRIWFADRAGELSSVSAAAVLSVQSLIDSDPGAVRRAVERAANETQTILPEQVRVECRDFGSRDVRLRVQLSREDGSERLATVVDKAVAEILKLRGVASIWRIDAPTESCALDGLEVAELLIAVAPHAADRREELVDDIRSLAGKRFPTTTVALGRPIAAYTAFPGVLGQFTLTMCGPDPVVLRRLAEDLQASVKKIPGASDVQLEPLETCSSLRIAARRDDATRYGLDPDALLELATMIVERRAASKVAGPQGEPIDLAIILDENDPAGIGRLPASAPDGARIPLQVVLDISIAESEVAFRQNGRQVVVLAFNVSGRDPVAVLGELQAVLNARQLPAGYSVE